METALTITAISVLIGFIIKGIVIYARHYRFEKKLKQKKNPW